MLDVVSVLPVNVSAAYVSAFVLRRIVPSVAAQQGKAGARLWLAGSLPAWLAARVAREAGDVLAGFVPAGPSARSCWLPPWTLPGSRLAAALEAAEQPATPERLRHGVVIWPGRGRARIAPAALPGPYRCGPGNLAGFGPDALGGFLRGPAGLPTADPAWAMLAGGDPLPGADPAKEVWRWFPMACDSV